MLQPLTVPIHDNLPEDELKRTTALKNRHHTSQQNAASMRNSSHFHSHEVEHVTSARPHGHRSQSAI
eukprot:9610338-Prorocentrum_lima.AAC.1